MLGTLKAQFPSVTFLVEEHLAKVLGEPGTDDITLAARADLMLILGGDGTLIHGARLLRGRPVPILGINMGSLGFLTEVPQAHAGRMLGQVLDGRYHADSRMKLSCRVIRDEKLILEDEVLNDIVMNKSALARIADHETWMETSLVALFKADGMILATPTGSTAYSLAAGGPIVHPSIDCVIITPICPHALTQKPIVVPGDQEIRIVLKHHIDNVFLTLDGKAGQPLRQGDCLEVKRSPNRVLLVRNPDIDYFGILRQKLHWGER